MSNNKHWTVEEIAVLVMKNREAALRGLAAITKLQTQDERAEKHTKHKNRLGFSKRHGTRGTILAQKYSSGIQLTDEEIQEVHEIAYCYREQLSIIANKTVSSNQSNAVKGTSDIMTQNAT